MEVAVTRGLLVLLLYLQISSAQQHQLPCNAGTQNSAFNYIPQQAQVSSQQLPSQNVQQQVTPQQNQVTDIISALYNLRSNPTYQDVSCGTKQSDPNLAAIVPTYATNQAAPASYDATKPTFSFQFIPATSLTNIPQLNPQVLLQSPTSSQSYYQTSNSMNPQSYQTSPAIPVANSQTNPMPSQPIVFTLQSPQTEVPSQSLQNQPAMLYTTQPQSSNQQTSKQTHNQTPGDQSMMSMIMSQLQSNNGNNNPLASILPSIMKGKQEKSSMKTLIPLILSLLNEKKNNCCQCGCPINQEPTIHSGYSSQKDYSKLKEKKSSVQPKNNSKSSKKNDNISEELSDEEYDDDEDDDVSDE